jgi:hypothetical protein
MLFPTSSLSLVEMNQILLEDALGRISHLRYEMGPIYKQQQHHYFLLSSIFLKMSAVDTSNAFPGDEKIPTDDSLHESLAKGDEGKQLPSGDVPVAGGKPSEDVRVERTTAQIAIIMASLCVRVPDPDL